MDIFTRTIKQLEAWDFLTNTDTKYVGYGGAAGGGKSYLGCDWLQTMCTALPESKWFIGRDSLKDTRESVLFTWRKLAKQKGLTDWIYRDNHIIFKNGSEIEFLDLSYYPQRDPLYERFGSKEYTGGWIEEAGNVHPMAFEVLKTRIGRWYNQEWNLVGKILITFNPKKNWLYGTFYRPYKNKQLDKYTAFIPALCGDNPYLSAEYIEGLKALKDEATKQRLLFGNFDYDDDPTCLLDYQAITAQFSNSHIQPDYRNGHRFITADIARYGSDRAIIMVWMGWVIVEYIILDKSATTQIQQIIMAYRTKYNIPARYCIADEDGIGGGVVDNCGILGFHNGGTPIDSAYMNAAAECGYKLADYIDNIYFQADLSTAEQQGIEEELGQIKTYEADKDGKLRTLPKEKVKENIGRSPDWGDNYRMRVWMELIAPPANDRAYTRLRGVI